MKYSTFMLAVISHKKRAYVVNLYNFATSSLYRKTNELIYWSKAISWYENLTETMFEFIPLNFDIQSPNMQSELRDGTVLRYSKTNDGKLCILLILHVTFQTIYFVTYFPKIV